MTLPYREERLLRRADRALSQSDPDLAAKLSIFAQITAAERLPAWEQLRPGLSWAWDVLLWPLAAVVFLVVIVAGGVEGRDGLQRGGQGPGAAVVLDCV